MGDIFTKFVAIVVSLTLYTKLSPFNSQLHNPAHPAYT